MNTSQYTSSMFFDNLLEILKFYSDLSKDDIGQLKQCGAMLRLSLSHYRQLHIIDCGSFYERLYFLLTLPMDEIDETVTLNVDSDHLIVDTGYIVNEIKDKTDSMPLSTNKTLLIFKTSVTHPCCVYVYNTKCPESPMKSYQFMLEQVEKYPPKVSFINWMTPSRNKTGPSFKGQNGVRGVYGQIVDADQVYALYYNGWPIVAQKWLTRKSESNWPTTLMKNVIQKSGCHIVPTGYEETHWRLSFSVAELILAHTLTTEQRHLYSITKFLIKYHCSINKIDGIKSYQLKTIFFWYCEEKHCQTQTMETSVRNLLNYIIEYYQHKYIPHYFIPSFNLIFDKTNDELKSYCNILKDLANNLVNILYKFITNTYHFVFIMDKDPIELYSKDHLRLNLFFKYNFYLFVMYGLLDNESITSRRGRGDRPIFGSRNTPDIPTNIEYRHFLSLITKIIHTDINIVNVLNSIADEIKSDCKILSIFEISGIICSVWRCSFVQKSPLSLNYYTCICWSCDMHDYYCRSIINLFNSRNPNIICRSEMAYKYKNLLFTMHYRPTKQTKNLMGCGFMKTNDYQELWPSDLNCEALYLLDYNIEMAFCAYQVLAYAYGKNMIDFFNKERLQSRLDKHKEIFSEFIEWIKKHVYD